LREPTPLADSVTSPDPSATSTDGAQVVEPNDATDPGPSGDESRLAAADRPGDVRLDINRLDLCPPEQLAHPSARAIAFHLAAGYAPYARLVECRCSNDATVEGLVVFEVEVEVPQHPLHDIRRVERIGVSYTHGVDQPPEVWALRESFPRDVPHLNLREYDYPRSLCLYDVPFRDVSAQWTPSRFIALIREWLRLTARGELHAEDQPLERMLIDFEGHLILPRAILAAETGTAVVLTLEQRPDIGSRPMFVAKVGQRNDVPGAATALVLRVEPRVHGAIQRTPKTLGELHATLSSGGDNLLGKVRGFLKPLVNDATRLQARCFIVILVPKQRTADGPVESTETWAFFLGKTIREIGEAIGVWATTRGGFGLLLWPDASHDGRDVTIGPASVVYNVARTDLASMNGLEAADDRRIVLVGGGALGSQVMMNAVRAGDGRWTVIDNDRLLPHNLARHALYHIAVGFPKAPGLMAMANLLTDDANVHEAIDVDLFSPGSKDDAVRAALAGADLIIDCSASVTVARHLARGVQASARRCSIFLNPSGTDLTLLAEDADRTVPIDSLEMQYYRAVATRADLTNALAASQSRMRYGRSCRDVSVALPQAAVGLCAGVATFAIHAITSAPAGHIRIWRLDLTTLGVAAVQVAVEPVQRANVNGWEVLTDHAVLRKLADLRLAKLPRETGGVLVGTYDIPRRILYIVDVIPSPLDSDEQATSYIRGVAGLTDEVERITAATAGQLHYVGEWHSHPAGFSCLPSEKDRNLFAWIAEELKKDSLPGLMVIVGDDGLAVPYLDRLGSATTYPASLRLGNSGPALAGTEPNAPSEVAGKDSPPTS
jgi:hypothetical protein